MVSFEEKFEAFQKTVTTSMEQYGEKFIFACGKWEYRNVSVYNPLTKEREELKWKS